MLQLKDQDYPATKGPNFEKANPAPKGPNSLGRFGETTLLKQRIYLR